MSKLKVRSGAVTMEIEDGLRDMMERAVRNSTPRTIGAIEETVHRLWTEAYDRWPVGPEKDEKGTRIREGGSGIPRPHSRELLTEEMIVDVTEGVVLGRISSGSAYGYYINSTQNGIMGNAWQVLVRRPLLEASDRIADILAEEIAKGARAA